MDRPTYCTEQPIILRLVLWPNLTMTHTGNVAVSHLIMMALSELSFIQIGEEATSHFQVQYVKQGPNRARKQFLVPICILFGKNMGEKVSVLGLNYLN